MEETPPKKKTELQKLPSPKKRSNVHREKALEKNVSAPAIMKIEKENKSTTTTGTKSENLKKSNSTIKAKGGKREHTKAKTLDIKKKEHDSSSSISVSFPSLRHSLDSNLASFFKVKSQKDTPGSNVRVPIDLAELPPPLSPSSSILLDGKPVLERSSSRSLIRHTYTRPSSNNLNPPELILFKKNFDSLTSNLKNKEKEIGDAKLETRKNETLIQKLTIDIQGSHILIQNLQKEHQTIKEKENSSSSVGSVVMRQKKKIRAYKEQLDSVESENAELKKLLQILRKHKKKDSKT